MVVRYLKDGQDFGPSHFSEVSPAFSGSARMPKGQPPMQDAKGGRIKRGVGGTMARPGDVDADDTYSMDHRKGGGRIKRAEGGSTWQRAGDTEDGNPRYVEMKQPSEADIRLQELRRSMNNSEGALSKAGGGRIRRASGGTIPGPAPAASAQPLTATATPAPNSGQQTNPLANATVSMPATDMAALTSKAVKMGAGAALSAIAQRNKAHGQVGAGGTAPAAAAPAGLSQSNPQPGIQGMATGGHINIKPSHRGLLHKDLGVPAGKPISQAKMDSAKAGASPAERKRITFAENARHWNKG